TSTQLPIAVALRIIADAARGLHYAHEFTEADGRPLQIVHRDVSPSNIFVGYEGQVKLLDFGIAKAESRATSTSVGSVNGRPLYMPPEQTNALAVDRRSDIYSLGVTLYEALTLSSPFRRDSTAGVAEAVLHGSVASPRTKRPEISVELERLIFK